MTSDKADPWKVVVLEHDLASEEVADFFEKIWAEGIIRKKIVKNQVIREKESVSKMIEEAVGNLEGRILTLYGHGCCHHYTYGLCNAIARKRSNDYMYIHVDNHSDSYCDTNGRDRMRQFCKKHTRRTKSKRRFANWPMVLP